LEIDSEKIKTNRYSIKEEDNPPIIDSSSLRVENSEKVIDYRDEIDIG